MFILIQSLLDATKWQKYVSGIYLHVYKIVTMTHMNLH